MNYLNRLYNGRIDRKNYLFGLIFYIVTTIFLLRIVLIPFFAWGSNNYNSTFANAIADAMILIYLIAAFHIIPLFVRRCHDMGKSIIFLIFLLIPIFNIVTFVMLATGKSEPIINKYGAPLPKNIFFLNIIFNNFRK